MRLLGNRRKFGSHLGLERIRTVCQLLENPQDRFKCVHIAGTNGKGSVAAMISQVLIDCGYRVGLYTSPHLVDFEERFRINGEKIPGSRLEALSIELESVFDEVGRILEPVTEFEASTALAFTYFAREKVDIAVIETGLGGRLDATNIVTPELAVITPIGLDHQEWLGPDLVSIGREKAGIIKEGKPVVIAKQDPQVMAELKLIANTKNALVFPVEEVNWEPRGFTEQGGRLYYPGFLKQEISVPLIGNHQLENAATALTALEVLANDGWDIPTQSVTAGMSKTSWPGRMELVSTDPWLLLDGAHNREGVQVLADNLRELAGNDPKQYTFVIGMLENKIESLVDPLLPLAVEMVFTKPASSRIPPKDPILLRDYVVTKGITSHAYPRLTQALQHCASRDKVVVCGSLYLIGELKHLWKKMKDFTGA